MKHCERIGKAIGLTGGLGCGKSEVGRILQEWGVPVLDADHVAHQQMAVGSVTYERIRSTFGEGILTATGEIDRRKLGALVFRERSELNKLNELVHPPVRAAWQKWVATNSAQHKAVAVIVPLLFEIHDEASWDVIWCVAADAEHVWARLRRRGWNDEHIKDRLVAQLPLEEKCRRADFVIHNNGTVRELENTVQTGLAHLHEKWKEK